MSDKTAKPSIRPAQKQDCKDIRELYLRAFADDEGPVVADMAITLLRDASRTETLSLIAEAAGAVTGHVAFSAVSLDAAPACRAFILTPLAVLPSHQRQKIGSTLVQTGIDQLRHNGLDLLFVYGDPKYYGRFGFQAEPARFYLPPYPLTYPFGWQVLRLYGFPHEDKPQAIRVVPALSRPELW